jgi:energy-coupling factor transport system ATP-binding protein
LRRRLADAGASPERVHDEAVTPLPLAAQAPPALLAERLVVERGQRPVLRRLNLTVRPGEVVALMGRNGAGKSTLLAAAAGQLPVLDGVLLSDSLEPAALRPKDLVQHVGLVPQDPGLLLYADSVGAECRSGDADMSVPAGTVRALLRDLAPDVHDDTHPRDLSEGQRLALALAIVLSGEPPLVLLDEPTRGLDYGAKTRLVHSLRKLAADGRAVLLATHDVELVADVADRVALLAEGEIVADGPTVDVLGGSPAFAPQVAKVMHPQPWLTVADLAAALEAS